MSAVNPYVVRYVQRHGPYRLCGSTDKSTHEMQFWAWSAADVLVQFKLWATHDLHAYSDANSVYPTRITAGVLHCPTCKGELITDSSGAWNIMFCSTCNHTHVVPMAVTP